MILVQTADINVNCVTCWYSVQSAFHNCNSNCSLQCDCERSRIYSLYFTHLHSENSSFKNRKRVNLSIAC